VVDVIPEEGVGRDEFLCTVAAAEKMSEHPISLAIKKYVNYDLQNIEISEFKALGGKGVYAKAFGKEIYGVNLKTAMEIADVSSDMRELGERLSGEGKTPLYFISDSRLMGVISVADTLRDTAVSALSELRDMGIKTVLLTGDNRRVAEAIGAPLGVDEIISDVLPDEKEAVVRRLMDDGRVMMVGDGINDAPALARADVGVAIGGGTDIAIESSDIVLMSDNVKDIPRAIKLGRRVLLNIKENLFWAFIYNVIGIPLAMGAFSGLGFTLTPMFGAAAMSVSSFIVVMNALRLNLFGRKLHRKEDTEDSSGEENTNEKDIETNKKENSIMTVNLKVEGMMCPHCEARVKGVLEAIPGVSEADVSYKEDRATVSGENLDKDTLVRAVIDAGYKAEA
jgi:Cu2+-exporting ATPase